MFPFMNPIALFDFDKTIINKDTGLSFILYALKRNFLRYFFALLITPVSFLFLISNKTRFIGNSIYLWVATVGLSKYGVQELRTNFINHYVNSPEFVIYKDALIKIEGHLEQGHRVLIISGASTWMVEGIIKTIDVPKLQVLGSDEQRLFGGMVSRFHCFEKNKVKILDQFLNLNDYTQIFGYSDSSTDIPLLSICHNKYVINPSKRSLIKFKKAFKTEITVLNWV